MENTYKQLMTKHYDVITEALEAEKKREVKFWKICAEAMGGPDGVADLTEFENDPCSHIMFYMRGQCKETVVVRLIRRGRKPVAVLRFVLTLSRVCVQQGPNAPKIKKIMGDLLEEFKPQD